MRANWSNQVDRPYPSTARSLKAGRHQPEVDQDVSGNGVHGLSVVENEEGR